MTLSTSHLSPVSPELGLADALAGVLRDWGIGAVYGVSGANIENFHDAIHRLGDERLVSIAARSENGAAFMADAQARVHGGVGVCCSTSGGGMMNLAVGVAESFQEGVPVLAVVGQIPRRFEGCGGFQDSSGIGATVHAEGMWRAISKEVRHIRSGDTFWEDLLQVVTAMLNGRQGPGVLLIPKDVFDERVPPRPKDWPTSLGDVRKPVAPTVEALEGLVSRLSASRRPVLILGKSVRGSKSAAAVHAFAREMHIPVVTTLADVGAFPNDDPLFLGTIGTAGHPSAHRYVNEKADLILAVGTKMELMFRAPVGPGLGRCATVFLDEELDLAARTFPTAEMVTGCLEHTFHALGDGRLEGVRWMGPPKGYAIERFLPTLAPLIGPTTAGKQDFGLLQSRALMMLQDVLPQTGQVLFDAGNCAASAMHYMTMPSATSTNIALGMGGMGYAIAGAIGAQLGGRPQDRTVVICGDGAFLMLGMEVHTAVDLELPILFVVLNNGKHGMCVTRQQLYFKGRVECSQYSRPSIAQLARGFGGPERVWVASADSENELGSALDGLERWDWSGPAVLDVLVGAEEVPPFTPFLAADAPTGALEKPNVTKGRARSAHAA